MSTGLEIGNAEDEGIVVARASDYGVSFMWDIVMNPEEELLFFSTSAEGGDYRVRRSNLDGSDVGIVVSVDGSIVLFMDLDIEDGSLFYSQGEELWKVPEDGAGNAEVFWTEPGGDDIREIKCDPEAGFVYYSTRDFTNDEFPVYRAPVGDGSAAEIVVEADYGEDEIQAIVIDNANGVAYFSLDGSKPNIHRVNLGNPGSAQEFWVSNATGTVNQRGLYLDSANDLLYWLEAENTNDWNLWSMKTDGTGRAQSEMAPLLGNAYAMYVFRAGDLSIVDVNTPWIQYAAIGGGGLLLVLIVAVAVRGGGSGNGHNSTTTSDGSELSEASAKMRKDRNKRGTLNPKLAPSNSSLEDSTQQARRLDALTKAGY